MLVLMRADGKKGALVDLGDGLSETSEKMIQNYSSDMIGQNKRREQDSEPSKFALPNGENNRQYSMTRR